VLKTLVGLGLTRLDSQIYIFLAKKGPQRGNEISKGLKVQKQQLYRSLKSLQSKGIVDASLEHPARFSAVTFDKVVDIFVKAKMAEANQIQENKEEILASWKAMAVGETSDTSAKFTVIEGRGPIYSRILQMIKETEKTFSIISTVPDMVRADQFGLFTAGYTHPSKNEIKFRFLTEVSEKNAPILKNLVAGLSKAKLNFEGRTPDLGLSLFNQMIIRDNEEAIFFITPRSEPALKEEEVCLWTNCKSLVQAFLGVFEDLWRNSPNVQKKIEEITDKKLNPETYMIENSSAALTKYDEIMHAAKREVIMMTSPEGLNYLPKMTWLLKDWAHRGISVKVMATIAAENISAAKQLSELCEIRHVPNSYLNSTIIDGQHLFQFRNQPSDQEGTDLLSQYENTFYTTNLEHIGKTENLLNEIWKKARIPSSATLESLIGPYGTGPAPLSGNLWNKIGKSIVVIANPEKKTEKDVLDKITSAKKYPVKDPSRDINRMYSSSALAVIHCPKHFNLPDIMFRIDHIEKQSSLGQGDALEVHVLSKILDDETFIPMGGMGDNPRGVAFRKASFGKSPAAQNYMLVKKNELQVRVYGNTLFAAWAIPIPLGSNFVLPPGCVTIEGHGGVKTTAYTAMLPHGLKCEVEQNWFDAFVTFMHPASKYSGPGTDGIFVRDYVVTMTPPQENGTFVVKPTTKGSKKV
jgi:sugar-specific transcriptional regulator TrmB